MSNREFTATRTMLANNMATAGAELLSYMGTSAALAAIPDTEPPRYVAAGTLKMIAKMLPGVEPTSPAVSPSPAAAGIGERVRAAMKRAYNLGQTYWQQADSEYASQNKKADVTAGRFIELTDETCADIEREVLGAHAGVVAAENSDWRKAEQDAYIDAMWPEPRQTEITDTDSSRDYLTKWMRKNFIGDTTFGYYIQKTLGGDFAYQLARAIEAKEQAQAASVVQTQATPLHWLPIELAPTDGTELLLTHWTPENGYGHVDFGCWGFIENSDYDNSPIYGWLSSYGNIEEPTHFINLAAPAAQAPVQNAEEVRRAALEEAINVCKRNKDWRSVDCIRALQGAQGERAGDE